MTAAVDQCRSIITNLSVHLSVYCERETLRWSGLMCVLFPHSGGSSVAPRLTDLVKLAQECCYHSNLAVAAHGIVVLANITVSCPENGELHWASGSPPLITKGYCGDTHHTTNQSQLLQSKINFTCRALPRGNHFARQQSLILPQI